MHLFVYSMTKFIQYHLLIKKEKKIKHNWAYTYKINYLGQEECLLYIGRRKKNSEILLKPACENYCWTKQEL